MRIGFVSLYSWRPHVEHLFYLSDLVKKAGHHVEFLTCDSDLPTCYTKEIRDIRPGWQECIMCRLGGIRSYVADNVTSIGKYSDTTIKVPDNIKTWGYSSASTLGRFESDDDYQSQEFKLLVERLQPSIEKTYRASLMWIDDKKLDALVVFNGRMDATRAIYEAGLHRGISVASLERTWFGDGLQILPQENCLGLKAVDKLVSEWSSKPLTKEQASISASYIASRFLKRNHNEWRAYNVNADLTQWPNKNGKYKILLVPGSINEIWGHPDWESDWKHPIEAFDAIIRNFNLKPNDIILRCHPNWGEKIGKVSGELPESFYTNWANKHGILVIPSSSKISTLGLIEQADAIVVSSGSAALEAGALGKQIIAVAGSNYQAAGFRDEAYNEEQLKLLTLHADLPKKQAEELQDNIRRLTLRFCYSITHRAPQYVDYVKAVTPTKYTYKNDGNPQRIINLLKSQSLTPDDTNQSKSNHEENYILNIIKTKQWDSLIKDNSINIEHSKINRRHLYRSLDWLRDKMPHGDR
jgi:hypothetical protein